MKLTITGQSTAFFSTWYLIEELCILFDAGDGVVSTLLNKVHKADHIFVSHAHRDHISGLQQTVQMGALVSPPTVYHPRDSMSFVHLAEFTNRFDDHARAASWQPVSPGDDIYLRDDLLVRIHRNDHVAAPQEVVKSIGFRVMARRRKLLPEFQQMPQNELRDLILEKGREHVTQWVYNTLVAYSGDTPVTDFSFWKDTEVLLHECTFLGGPEDETLEERSHTEHSSLPDVLRMACISQPGKLVLGHFSSRYSNELIKERVTAMCHEMQVPCPVWLVLPGVVEQDILARPADYALRA